MEILYRRQKKGKRSCYIPTETYFGHSLPDGIWEVSRNKRSSSVSSITHRIAKLKQPVDLPRYLSLFQFRQKLIDWFSESGETEKFVFLNVSSSDMADEMIAKFYDLIHEKEDREERKRLYNQETLFHARIVDCSSTFLERGYDVEVYDSQGEYVHDKCKTFFYGHSLGVTKEAALSQAKSYVAQIVME